jgi:hypothetical protein
VKIRSTSVQGLLRTGGEDWNAAVDRRFED